MRDESGEAAPAFSGPRENRRNEGYVGGAGRDCRATRGNLFQHGWLDITEVVAPVNEPWHGRAAGVEHEADTRGTEVEKRDTYSLTGIEAAFSASMVDC